MSSDLDGNDRTAIVRNLQRPLGLALYKDRLYWSVTEGGENTKNKHRDSKLNLFFFFQRWCISNAKEKTGYDSRKDL